MTPEVMLLSGEKKRQAIYAFIAQFIEKEQVSPTIREIAKALGIPSHSDVSYHLYGLQKRGLITWKERKARTIRLVSMEGK